MAKLDEGDQARLDSEFVTVNAVRELINLATHGDSSKATYSQALKLGALICPDILGEKVSLLQKARESSLAREYRQKAEAIGRKTGKEVSPVELIDKELAELDDLLQTARNQQRTDQLRRRRKQLSAVRIEVDPTATTEHQLIFRDAYNVDRGLPEVGFGQGYKDFELDDRSLLRIRVLHPDKPEQITGADMLYERHHPTERLANIVAVQYKIWENRLLSLGDERLQQQLTKMNQFACNEGLCIAGSEDHSFRFPYCAAFLRPTDKLQRPDQKLASSGEHIPICQIDELMSKGPRGGKYLTYDNMRDLSLNHAQFEGLFTSGKIGSRTLAYEELDSLYKRFSVIGASDRVFIHAQDVGPDDSGYDEFMARLEGESEAPSVEDKGIPLSNTDEIPF